MPISQAVPSSTTGPSSQASRTFAFRTPAASTRNTSPGVSSFSSEKFSCGTKQSNPSPRSRAASTSSQARSASENSGPAT